MTGASGASDAGVWADAWAHAWNAHDADRVTRRYSPDGSHRMAGGNTYTGADALGAMVGRTLAAYPDLRFTVRGAFTAGDRFAIEYTMHGTQTGAIGNRPGTGAAVTVDGALVGSRDAAGRITACIDYLDHHDIRRQLGLTPDH